MKYIQNKGKECSPNQTIKKICECLEHAGISHGIEFYESDIEGCYSSRVYVEGKLSDAITANGKGTTKEYCLASGMAELMERIQNQIFLTQLKSEDIGILKESAQEIKDSMCQYVPLDSYIEDSSSFINKVVRKYKETMDDALENKEECVWMQLHKLFPTWKSQGVFSIPFYHVQADNYEMLPLEIIKSVNMSNGMAAGNTIEEAIVQGYSEIFERFVQMQVIKGTMILQTMSEEEIKEYPYIVSVIQKIESTGRYRVIIKECMADFVVSVMCGIIVDKEKNTFGVRFGAHPNKEIALERIFTEAMQGKRLQDFASLNVVCYDKQDVCAHQNMFNLMKTGVGMYPPTLFVEEKNIRRQSKKLDVEISNAEWVVKITDNIKQLGKETYIADMSYLGFPTVLIYVEDMSELIPIDYIMLKVNAIKNNTVSFLQDIAEMNKKRVENLLLVARLLHRSVLENTISAMIRMPVPGAVHGKNDEIGFLRGVCKYYLNDDVGALEDMRKCLRVNEDNDRERQYISLVIEFLKGKIANYDMERLHGLLNELGDTAIAESVWNDFSKRQDVFKNLYPNCRKIQCNNCPQDLCIYDDIRKFYKLLYCKMLEWNGWKLRLKDVFSK